MNTTASPEHASAEALLAQITDDFLKRLNAGEQPAIEEYAQRYPDLADVLRQVLPALCVLRQPPSADSPADGFVSGVLGDFRILREVGRGGMGVVYEAEQISLGRRVALKVLPLAATMDPRHLQRFHNEARAAAGLHQEHIVPVHAVGCERGVHFYAMQFIDGQTLAEWIEQQHTPDGVASEPTEAYRPPADSASAETVAVKAEVTPAPAPVWDAAVYRQVAEWGVDAAEALEYAHSVGIVHRDIKPANLMVDSQGKLWVTDFGLARTAGDSGLTMTGDLVGTLRYMSPEQALAKHGLVDHRTDVYSLGVTLYELLTLRPAVDGKDRQEILRRIAFEEPVAPRSLNRAIPLELETVVLKAMAKEPAERYTTAKQLAEDLRRFLNDRPVLARRPSLMQRAWRWARRHRSLVGSLTASLLLAVVALSLSVFLLLREKTRAEARLEFAQRAADEMYTEFAQGWLAREPGKEETRRQFLLKALQFYERLAEERSNDPKVRYRLAGAYESLGDVGRQRRDDDAAATYRRAIALLEALAAQCPDRADYLHSLAKCYMKLGFATEEEVSESLRFHRLAAAQMHKLSADFPDRLEFRQSLGVTVHNLGYRLVDARQMEEAEAMFVLASSIFEHIHEDYPNDTLRLKPVAVAQLSLGEVFRRRGEWRRAEEAYRRCESYFAMLAPELPLDHWGALEHYDWHQRAIGLLKLGTLLFYDGRTQEGKANSQRALAIWKKLTGDFPRSLEYHENLGFNSYLLGQLYDRGKRVAEAEALYHQAQGTLERLVRDAPQYDPAPGRLAHLLTHCPRTTLQNPARALTLARRAAELRPKDGRWWIAQGAAHYRLEDDSAALTSFAKADGLNHSSENGRYFFQAMAHWRLGDKDQARACYAKGVESMEKHDLELWEHDCFRAEAAELLGIKGPTPTKESPPIKP